MVLGLLMVVILLLLGQLSLNDFGIVKILYQQNKIKKYQNVVSFQLFLHTTNVIHMMKPLILGIWIMNSP